MNTVRVDSDSWLPDGAVLFGEGGFGVMAETIPVAGYSHDSLQMPSDTGKEICGRITTWPSAGTLQAVENTEYVFFGAPPGSYNFQFQLYVDGIARNGPVQIPLFVGGVDAQAPGATLTGTAELVSGAPSVGGAAPGATLTGTATLTPGTAEVGGAVAGGATLTGMGEVVPGAAEASSAAPGAALTGQGELIAGTLVLPSSPNSIDLVQYADSSTIEYMSQDHIEL